MADGSDWLGHVRPRGPGRPATHPASSPGGLIRHNTARIREPNKTRNGCWASAEGGARTKLWLWLRPCSRAPARRGMRRGKAAPAPRASGGHDGLCKAGPDAAPGSPGGTPRPGRMHRLGLDHWAMSDFSPPTSATGRWYESLEVAVVSCSWARWRGWPCSLAAGARPRLHTWISRTERSCRDDGTDPSFPDGGPI